MKTTINNRVIEIKKDDLDRSLVGFLREDLDLTGTKNGCNIGVCGSCTIIVNGKAKQSCRLKLSDVIGKEVLTIEGVTPPDGLNPLQRAFLDHGAVQCGFCTPGMIMAAHAFLMSNDNPTRKEIRRAISPNLCRCTGYQQIIEAIESAAVHYRK
ncbi:MAG: (2Fe-2S)-binding protein [Deltaproteobacteria bacterium]|nr:(2Fe-2S)-binding protein [Deltaproteobacteria bacterium]